MTESSNNTRIAKNTVMLYTRQLIIMLVNLYTVRVILYALGQVDYGLYTVVAGIVTMFSLFSGAMASASQRYFSFDIGEGNYERLKNTFSMSLLIYVIITIFVILIMETLGLRYVLNVLSIPTGRESAVVWVYEATLFSLVCTMLTTPYMALIIAHENMNVYAIFSIIEAVLKLTVASIIKIIMLDKLIVFAVLTAISNYLITFLYKIYCKKMYQESKFDYYWNKSLFCELFSFTGWNLFGSAVGAFKVQLINIVLNQNFSQTVVTSRGIATSLNSAVISFSQSFGTAIKPVIVKEYAAGNYNKLNKLIGSGSKATFLLMYIFILPLGFEMDYILTLWLGTVPTDAVLFTTLTIIDALIDSVSYPLMSAALATGKIKLYQAVVGGIQLMNFPIAWLVIMSGAPAVGVFMIAILLSFSAFIARIVILSQIMDFSIATFLKKTLVPIAALVCITIWGPIVIVHLMLPSFLRLVVTTLTSFVLIIIVFWFLVADKEERSFIIQLACRKGILK